jgi:hypothetical protein
MKSIPDMEVQLGKLHDNVLLGVEVQWREAVVSLSVRAWSGQKRLIVQAFTRLVCPRANPWGPSVCIVGGRISSDPSGTGITITIEMQSGDEIVIDGREAELITSEQ